MTKKTKRITSRTGLIPIADWQTADHILRSVGQLQNEIRLHELACAERIDAAKDDLRRAVAPLHDKIDRQVKSLEAFCCAHREAFGRHQSKTLQSGKVGFRRSTAICVKKTTLERIKAFFGRAAVNYLIIKEQVSKDALSDLPDDTLAQIDARRIEKEIFFVEPEKIESVPLTDDDNPR